MRRRLPPVQWLRTFEVAARHLSFTAAAREMGLTQSAVSQQIKLLEQFLQRPLFRRLPQALQLTDAGAAYLPVVRRAFEGLLAGTAEVFGTSVERRVTLRTTVSFGALWLAPRLPRFQAAHPEMRLRLVHSLWPADFLAEGVDLEVRIGEGRWPGLRAEALTRDRLLPVVAPAGAAGLAVPADLAGRTLLHAVGFQEGWSQWLTAAGVAERVGIDDGWHLDSQLAVLELAAEGLGVALGRSCFVERYRAEGRLVTPFETSIASREAYYLTWPEDRPNDQPVKLLRDWLLAEAAAGAGGSG